jgi:hypothetical protein
MDLGGHGQKAAVVHWHYLQREVWTAERIRTMADRNIHHKIILFLKFSLCLIKHHAIRCIEGVKV